ncbi:MAG: iron ABC transporter permease [Thermomicrobiales bacterium]
MITRSAPLDAPSQKPGHVVVRRGYVAWRVNVRVLLFALIGLLILMGLGLWSMTLGEIDISAIDAVRATFGRGDADTVFVMQQLRVPRILSAMLIGGCLAVSGAILQGLVRNPLVSPDIVGIDAGASAAAVFWILAGLSASALPISAFLGAMATAVAIYILSWKGGISPDRLILVGIGIAAALQAVTTFLLIRTPPTEARPAQVWTIGSIYGSSWHDIRWLAPVFLVGLLGSIVLMWPLRLLQLGDDLTRGLGVSLERTRLSLILIACILAAVAVAIAGPIPFVALMTPHMVKLLVGPLSGSVMVLIAVAGGIFLLSADMIGQHAMPISLPVGLLTAAVGGPYFLYLLYRTSARS